MKKNCRASVLALFGVLLLGVAIPSAAFDVESDGMPGRRGHLLQKKLFDNGLNLKTTGDCALIAPPLIAEKDHIDVIADILRKTVSAL